MADINSANVGANGVAFIVSYEIACAIIAKACSSPQTTELNANIRAETLMKWVNIGTAETLGVIAVAAWIDPRHRSAIVAGGILSVIVTYAEYVHARNAGLANPGPATEQYQ
jgi:hypothetical protein